MATQNKNFKVKNGLDVTGAISATSTVSASGLSGSLLSSASPLSNGTAAAGTSTVPAREDHVHPGAATGSDFVPALFLGVI